MKQSQVKLKVAIRMLQVFQRELDSADALLAIHESLAGEISANFLRALEPELTPCTTAEERRTMLGAAVAKVLAGGVKPYKVAP